MDLSGARLIKTVFYATKLFAANFLGADLAVADLRGANLGRADLGAALAYARPPDQPIPASGSFYGGAGAQASSDGGDVAALRKQLIAALERNLEQPVTLE